MIGFVHNYSTSLEFANYLLKFSAVYNVPFCVIQSKNLSVHYDGNPLIATVWQCDDAAEQIIDLPPVLDTVGELFSDKYADKYKEGFLPWLRKSCNILTQSSFFKDRLSNVLLTSNLSLYAIPTWNVDSYDGIQSILKLANKIIIKPVGGKMGKGICRLEKIDNQAIICHDASGDHEFDPDWFLDYQNALISSRLGRLIIAQPCLDFSLDDRHAVDFRLLRHRGRTSEWEEVATYARIGASSLVSNVSQGGYIADAKDILSEIAGDTAQSLYDEIMYIGQELPLLIQKHKGDSAYCLGMDIAIDRQSMRPFILEANTYPGTKYHACQLAEKRVQYYRYLLNCQKT